MNYKHYSNELAEYTKDIDFSKFKETEGDLDDRNAERSFSGRMTKKRWQIINRICRVNSFRTHCHHEYDCCGCLSAQYLEVTYKSNQVVIHLTQSFNY